MSDFTLFDSKALTSYNIYGGFYVGSQMYLTGTAGINYYDYPSNVIGGKPCPFMDYNYIFSDGVKA